MADELLSIESSVLESIANAIRTKGGTSADLEFPNGFVSALQAITTEATVTPKITPQQKVLTPSETSFSIDSGFHDGTGTVAIQLDTTNNSANPTTTQQTYYPASGKFFGSFSVGGIGNGYQMAFGTMTLSNANSMTVSGLTFTPNGGVFVLDTDTNSSGDTYTGGFYINDSNFPNSYGFVRIGSSYYCSVSSSSASNAGYGYIQFLDTTVSSASMKYFRGTYYYVVWGN